MYTIASDEITSVEPNEGVRINEGTTQDVCSVWVL